MHSENEINIKSYRLIKKICKNITTSLESYQSLLEKLIESYKLLNLNDFEITFWSIILDRALVLQNLYPLNSLVILTAYASKANTNRFLDSINKNIDKAYPGFKSKYNEWIKLYPELTLSSPQEINKKYQELCMNIDCKDEENYLNYESIVDQLVNNWVRVKEEEKTEEDLPIDWKAYKY